MKDNITVTIWCIVYNHAKYIRGTLESFLNQKTSYNYEVLVHDDCSTDGTVDILREYEQKYPDLIKVFYEEENLYSKRMLRDRMYEIVQTEARGKYIALCEGDDFWIDNQKLQIQIDYLEQHQECVMTAHNGLQFDMRDGSLIAIDGLPTEKDVSGTEIFQHYKNCFPTASMVMKKDTYILKEPFRKCLISDWPLMISAVLSGTIHYFDRIMSVYRIFGEGSWTESIKRDTKKHLVFSVDMACLFGNIREFAGREYQEMITQIEAGFLYEGANCILEKNDRELEIMKAEVDRQLNGLEDSLWNKVLEQKKVVQEDFETLRHYIDSHNSVFVFGTGDVANFLSEKLILNQIYYDGYVVSDGQPVREKFWGKNVWRLSEIAEMSGVGIVIAIKKKMKSAIEPVLAAYSISDYYWFGM